MNITFREIGNLNRTHVSGVGFEEDGTPVADTPAWADSTMVEYILHGARELWDFGGTIAVEGITYTIVPEHNDIIPILYAGAA